MSLQSTTSGMTSSQAGRVIMACSMLEAGFIVVHNKRTRRDDVMIRSLLAIGGLTFGLLFLAEMGLQAVAAPFALLILVALAARSRGELGEVLGVSAASAPQSRPGTPGRSRPAGTPPSGGGSRRVAQ